MPVDLISLALITLVAAVCPILAGIIPGKPIPETVFLLLAGALLGPNLLGVIFLTDSVSLLSDLGLAFLFLLAGYEINPKSLTGSQGKRGLVTWIVSFALALAFTWGLNRLLENDIDALAISITLVTTALGTLMPILKERGLMGTRVGDSILSYGTWGELCPVLAMALLLSSRAEWLTLLILAIFLGIAITAAVIPSKARKAGHRLFRFLTDNADGTSQTMMRVTVLLLVGLVAISAVFDLDIVLGAFAAGFVLRYIIPQGNDSLEHKLDGVGYGLLIPIFFICSGAKIDLAAVFEQPAMLIGFIVMLLALRAVPIYLALSTGKDTRDLSSHNRLTIALYCTTALPVVVAVTSVAVSSGAMPQETASVLVAAGAITVFLMPLLGNLTYHVADAAPIEAVREIRENPSDIGAIVRQHIVLEKLLSHEEAAMRAAALGRAHAATFVSRHLPTFPSQSMESWVVDDPSARALKALAASDIDEERWKLIKQQGDETWQQVKEEGDERWLKLKAAGDKRWEAVKAAGDEAVGLDWADRAGLLQERTQQKRDLEAAFDEAAREIAAQSEAMEESHREQLSKEDLRAIRREQHRKLATDQAIREHHRRMMELTKRVAKQEQDSDKQ